MDLGYGTIESLDLSMLNLIKYKGNSNKKFVDLQLCNTLQEIEMQSNEMMTGTLDVSSMPDLKKLNVAWSKFSDITFTPSLEELDCSSNQFEGTLDVSALTNLKKLYCSRNQLTEVILSNQLEEFNCSFNNITAINVKNIDSLRVAYIHKNKMPAPKLNELYQDLPDRNSADIFGKLYVLNDIADETDDNQMKESNVCIAFGKNWKLFDINGNELTGMIVSNDTLVSWNDASGDIVIPDSIRVIGDNCFKNNPNITSITGNGIEYIGGYSGDGCTNLTQVNFPNLKGFKLWSAPNSLPFDIDEKVVASFQACPNLAPIIAGNTLFWYRNATGDVTLPDNITTIYHSAFVGATTLKSLNAPGVTEICSSAFSESFSSEKACKELESCVVPNLRKTTGRAFRYLNNLQSVVNSYGVFLWRGGGHVTVPEGTEVIGDYAFGENTQVTSVTLPASLKEIRYGAFYKSTSLTGTLTLPESLEYIGVRAFEETSISGKLTIPASVKTLSKRAFYKNSQLTSLDIQAHVKQIREETFAYCSGLTEVTFGKAVNILYTNSFVQCTNLKKLNMHSLTRMQFNTNPWHYEFPLYGTGVNEFWVPAALVPSYQEIVFQSGSGGMHGWSSGWIISVNALPNSTGNFPVTWENPANGVIEVSIGDNPLTSGSNVAAGTVIDILVKTPTGFYNVDEINISGAMFNEVRSMQLTVSDETHITAILSEIAELADMEPVITMQTNADIGKRLKMICVTPLYEASAGIYKLYPVVIDWGNGAYVRYETEYPQTYSDSYQYIEKSERIQGEDIKIYCDNPEMIRKFRCNYMEISQLDVTKATELEHLYCGATSNYQEMAPIPNTLTELNLANNTKLTQLDCSHNQLTSLDLSNNTELEQLTISYNPIQSIDLSHNTKLNRLYYNGINCEEMLDVTNNTELVHLHCANNNIHTINVQHLTKLEYLYCPNNPVDIWVLPSNLSYIDFSNPSYQPCEWNGLFEALPMRTADEQGEVLAISRYILPTTQAQSQLQIIKTANTQLASGKNWKVMENITSPNGVHQEIVGNNTGCLSSYKVTFSATNGSVIAKVDGVQISSGAMVGYNKEVTFTLSAQNEHYIPSVLNINGVDVAFPSFDTVQDYVLKVKGNTNLQAMYVPVSYLVSYAQPANGSLSVKSNGVNVASGSYLPYGSTLTITATPAANYMLDKIIVNGTQEYTTSPQTITLDGNTNISALFKLKEYTVTYSQPANGSLVVTSDGSPLASGSSVPHGTSIVVSATPNANYELAKLTINGVDYTSSPQNVTVTENVVVSATFTPVLFTVNYSQPANGTIVVTNNGSPVANGGSVPYGSTLVVKAIADSGYELEKLTINGTDYTSSPQNITVTEDITVSATFVLKSYTVTYSQPANGTLLITNNGTPVSSGSTVEHGTTLVVTATPNANYELAKLTINGMDYTSSPQNITVTEDVTVSATFVLKSYTVTYSQPANGTISVTNNGVSVASGSSVTHGTTLVVSATANEGYDLDKLTINGVDYTSSPQNITVTEDVTVSATVVPKSYTVTYSQPANGTISVTNNGASVASGSSVTHGTTLVVTATPNEDYELDILTINGVDYTSSPQNVTVR